MPPSKDSLSPLVLVLLFTIWYSFNAGYNVYNATLKVFPLPITIAALQLLVGLLYVFPLWILGIRKVLLFVEYHLYIAYEHVATLHHFISGA